MKRTAIITIETDDSLPEAVHVTVKFSPAPLRMPSEYAPGDTIPPLEACALAALLSISKLQDVIETSDAEDLANLARCQINRGLASSRDLLGRLDEVTEEHSPAIRAATDQAAEALEQAFNGGRADLPAALSQFGEQLFSEGVMVGLRVATEAAEARRCSHAKPKPQ